MATLSNPISVSVVSPAGLPSWVPSPGNWAQVSLNTLSSVGLGSEAPNGGSSWSSQYYNIWASACYAPTLGTYGSLIVTADGGHGSYNGNDVYRYDIGTRLWTQFKDTYRGVTSGYSNSFGEFPDGSPLPPHTYDGLEFTTFGANGGSLGSVILPWTYNDFNNTGEVNYAHYLDLQTKVWVRGPGRADGRHVACAVDPVTNRFFLHGGDGASYPLRSFLCDASSAVTTYTGTQLIETDSTMTIDYINRKLMILSVRSADATYGYHYWDMNNLNAGRTRVSSPGVSSSASSLEYVELTNAYYVIQNSDRSVWKLAAGSLGSAFTQESDSGTRPGATTNGMYGKIRWVSAVKCFIGCTQKTANVFAYRPVGT